MDDLMVRRARPCTWCICPSILVAGVTAAFMLSACAFPPFGGAVEILIPAVPPQWTGLWEGGSPTWSLDLIREGERMRLGSGCRPGERLRVDAGHFSIGVILVLPEGGGSGLKPAGALLPLDARPGPGGLTLVEPDSLGGWIASAAAALMPMDFHRAEAFDWMRLREEARARLADPWTCPPEALAGKIAAGAFSLRLLKPAPSWPLRLEGGLPCDFWIPESPFAPPLSAEGGVLTLECAEGLHQFLSPSHRLALSVDARGMAVWRVLEREAHGAESPAFGASEGRFRSAIMRTSMRMTRARM